MAEATSKADDAAVRAGTARQRIDQQDTYREHLHRDLRAASDADCVERESIEARRLRLVTEKTLLQQERDEVMTKIRSGERFPSDQWRRMQEKQAFLLSRIRGIDGHLGSLRSQEKLGVRTVEQLFVDFARLMLDANVFEEILVASVRKHDQLREVNVARNTPTNGGA